MVPATTKRQGVPVIVMRHKYKFPMDDLLKIQKLCLKAQRQEKALRASIGPLNWERKASAITPTLVNLEQLIEYLAFPEGRMLCVFVEDQENDGGKHRANMRPIVPNRKLRELLYPEGKTPVDALRGGD